MKTLIILITLSTTAKADMNDLMKSGILQEWTKPTYYGGEKVVPGEPTMDSTYRQNMQMMIENQKRQNELYRSYQQGQQQQRSIFDNDDE